MEDEFGCCGIWAGDGGDELLNKWFAARSDRCRRKEPPFTIMRLIIDDSSVVEQRTQSAKIEAEAVSHKAGTRWSKRSKRD